MTAIVVSAWFFGQVILGFIAMAFVFIMVLSLNDDATPVLPVLATIAFILPLKAAQDTASFIEQNFVFMAVLVGVMLLSVVVFFVLNRRRFTFGKQFVGLAVGAVAFLCSGLLYDVEAWKASIPSVSMYVLVVLFVYLFSVNGISKGVSKTYFAKIFMHVGIIMVLNTTAFYVFDGRPFDVLIHAKAVNFGWGISNNLGSILLLTMPLTMYLVVREDKTVFHTVYYVFWFVAQVVALILSLSRGAVLPALIGVPACIVFTFIFAKKKTKLFVSLAVVLLLLAGLFIWQWDKVQLVFQQYTVVGEGGAIHDSGRFDLYKQAWEDFLKSPILGLSPFHTIDPMAGQFFPLWYHNTVLQILVNAGIFGIIGYVLHLICTYRVLCTRKARKFNKFIFMGIFMWTIHGMLDPCYSMLSQLILFVILIVFAEFGVPKDFKVFPLKKKKGGRLY